MEGQFYDKTLSPLINSAVSALAVYFSYKTLAMLATRYPVFRDLVDQLHDKIIDQVEKSQERIEQGTRA